MWTDISGSLGTSEELTCMAIAPSSNFTVAYAGIRGSSTSKLGARTGDIWSTSGSGTTLSGGSWSTFTPTGTAASLSPNAIAVDYSRPERAFAVFGGATGGAVLMTENSGASWTQLSNVGFNPLPPLLGIAIDPTDPTGNTLYVGTIITMLSAKLSGTTLTWAPYDAGLPDGVDVTDVWVNRATNLLNISTMGYGAYEREIAPGTCPGTFLLVRDNVFDRGNEPSTYNEPNPEHPIQAGIWYEPDNSVSGRTHWWASTDIRIEVPDNATLPGNQVPPPGVIDYLGSEPPVDHVEMETCPLYGDRCAPGFMIDSNPARGRIAKVRIQVTNQGLFPVSNVRVIALWRSAGSGLPDLPSNFWTYQFPANATSWPTFPAVTGWRAVDPNDPVRTIPVVNAGLPEVVTFDWLVPSNIPDHCCMYVIVESADDPISSAHRNLLDTSQLAKNDRHIAQRNLHIIGAREYVLKKTMSLTFMIGNPSRGKGRKGGIDLFVSKVGMPAGVLLDLELPDEWKLRTRGAERLSDSALVEEKGRTPGVRSGKWTMKNRFLITADEAVFEGLPVRPGTEVKARLSYSLPEGFDPGGSTQINVLARQGKNVLGGNSFILRAPEWQREPEEGERPKPIRGKR